MTSQLDIRQTHWSSPESSGPSTPTSANADRIFNDPESWNASSDDCLGSPNHNKDDGATWALLEQFPEVPSSPDPSSHFRLSTRFSKHVHVRVLSPSPRLASSSSSCDSSPLPSPPASPKTTAVASTSSKAMCEPKKSVRTQRAALAAHPPGPRAALAKGASHTTVAADSAAAPLRVPSRPLLPPPPVPKPPPTAVIEPSSLVPPAKSIDTPPESPDPGAELSLPKTGSSSLRPLPSIPRHRPSPLQLASASTAAQTARALRSLPPIPGSARCLRALEPVCRHQATLSL
ncbi:hypothetical protein R3P38DRAFT_3200879 [Favolaschia claudopus]|uniref:Uncharacterized protein n=1 Tax=Favolaschia claudopus TaxID=2862362 RepID=A0AAW0AY54_9AGAR